MCTVRQLDFILLSVRVLRKFIVSGNHSVFHFMHKLSPIIFLCFSFGCNQNNLVGTKVLAQFSSDTIYYDAFQTGIDNYRIEIKSKSGSDIEHLFDYYINDGIFTETTLRASIKGDTAFISSRQPVGNEEGQTKHGRIVLMQKL